MAFFKRREKELSRQPRDQLAARYERTEKKLQSATKTGDLRAVKAAMKEHHEAEYAMLHKDYASARRRRQRSKRR